MRYAIIIVCFFLICKLVCNDQLPLSAYLDSYIQSITDAQKFSGTVLVAKDNTIVLKKGYGYANHEHQSANSCSTKFRIASLTKQFTATAILLLEIQNLLHVTDTIDKYIPDYPRGNEITIHHLLTHTSGIADMLEEYAIHKRMPSSSERTISFFKQKPLHCNPGLQFLYSNAGYIILSYIIEQLTHTSYENFVQETIFKPLQMAASGYDHYETILENRAAGYAVKEEQLVHADFVDMSIASGAGALYATVEDLYRWDRALYDDYFLAAHMHNRLFTCYTSFKKDSWGIGYGYGWGIDEYNGHKVVMHMGNIDGFASIISRFIEDNMCIIILSNFEFAPIIQLHNFIASSFLGDGQQIMQKRNRSKSVTILGPFIEQYDEHGYVIARSVISY